jgi:uncharacterized UPF0160 family protein
MFDIAISYILPMMKNLIYRFDILREQNNIRKLCYDALSELNGRTPFQRFDYNDLKSEIIDFSSSNFTSMNNFIRQLAEEKKGVKNTLALITSACGYNRNINIIKYVLERRNMYYCSLNEAKHEIEESYKNNGSNVLVLDTYMPYLKFTNEHKEILYVMFPQNRGGWCLMCAEMNNAEKAKAKINKTKKCYRILLPEIDKTTKGFLFEHASKHMAIFDDFDSCCSFANNL